LTLHAEGGNWLALSNFQPDQGLGITGQEARLDIVKPGTPDWSFDEADVLAQVFTTVPGGLDQAWAPIKFDLTPWAGQQVKIRFRWIMGETYQDSAIDNVKILNRAPVKQVDNSQPVISSAKLGAHRFYAATSGTELMAATKKGGTKLTFNLSEAATIRVSLKRYSSKGWATTAGTATLTGVPGANASSFAARLSAKKPLAPGKYMILLTPTDAAGNSGQPTELVIRVLTPR
jgi:hypothetical protein